MSDGPVNQPRVFNASVIVYAALIGGILGVASWGLLPVLASLSDPTSAFWDEAASRDRAKSSDAFQSFLDDCKREYGPSLIVWVSGFAEDQEEVDEKWRVLKPVESGRQPHRSMLIERRYTGEPLSEYPVNDIYQLRLLLGRDGRVSAYHMRTVEDVIRESKARSR